MRLALVLAALSLSACTTTRPPSHPLVSSNERYLDWEQFHHAYGIDPVTADQARGRWHYAFVRDHGEVVEVVRMAPTGQPFGRRKISKQPDGSSQIDVYDQWGVLDKIVVVDANGYESTTHRSGVMGDEGCHHKRHFGDATGVIAETICYDAANRPIVGDAGCERIQFVRDARRHPIDVACFRADGTKATFASEYHREKATVDAMGYATSFDYLDPNGAPVTAGCAHEEREHAASGSTARRRCTKRDGSFDWETRWTFDANGCRTKIAYVDAAGNPLDRVEAASIHFRTDVHCADLRSEKRDSKGRLNGIIAIRTFVRNAAGDVTIERCLDSLQHPISCAALSPGDREGAEIRYDYDGRARVTRLRCYTVEGKPDLCMHHGAHDERLEYADDGRLFARSFFDVAGRPTSVHGIARKTYERDAFGSVIAERSFGVDGAPITPYEGCHEMRWAYDAHHRLEFIECRDTAGKGRSNSVCVIGSKTCFAKGASRIRVVRTGGDVVNVHLDPDGKELLRVDCEHGYCVQ